MSNLKLANPLDRFSSYSTHFIVLAARTTENARVFADKSKERETLDAIEKVAALGEAVPYGSSRARGDVVLLMDTRRFSQFSIEALKYEVLINGLSKGNSHSNLANIIELTVLDTVGISFINFLQWVMDSKLQTNFDGLIFLIRTIFIGHNPDGTSETIQSITIPAHLFKLSVNLDYAKGVYEMQLMPNFNFSVTDHRRWLNIGAASSFYSGDGSNKLGDVVQAFENRLNDASLEFYNRISPVLLKAGREPNAATGKFGRLVRYQITLPSGWDELTFAGRNSNSSSEKNFKQELEQLDRASAAQPTGSSAKKTETAARDSHMSTQPSTLITDVLDLMFKQVPDIQRFANSAKVQSSDQFVTFYKHVVSISSDDDVVIVHVDVVAFEVPNVVPPRKDATSRVSQHQSKFYTQVTDPASGLVKNIPRNYFELDYIYSGKNLDILNFDMKIQDLQFMLASKVQVGQGDLVAQSIQGQGDGTSSGNPGASAQVRELLSMRPYDPFLMPLRTVNEETAYSHLTASIRDRQAFEEIKASQQQYARNLSAFYAISPIQVSMTIKGNPDIMAKFNLPEPVPHKNTATNQGGVQAQTNVNLTVKQDYRREFEERVLRTHKGTISPGSSSSVFTLNPQLGDASYVSTPVFVGINIYGPNVDFSSNELIAGQDFATRVLFDNYYVVFKVTNIIEKGVFTQQLELWSHNVFGVNKLTDDQKKNTKLRY